MIDYQPKIMAVDDTPANLKLLEEMLRARGCQVRSFSCGRLALAAAATEPPDLILLDINMPEMNGYEVCCQLKADAKLAAIPVIFISALNETMDKVKAFGCGGVDYVTKPFQFAEVYARVETHLKLRWLQRELEKHNTQLDKLVRLKTRQLAEAHDRLSILDKTKSDFLGLISHELRTPLNGVFAIGELLMSESPSNSANAELAGIFQQSRQRLLGIMEDAFLLTQIEVGMEKFSPRLIPLSPILRLAVQNTENFARNRNVFIGPVPDDVRLVRGEATLFAKAIQALLETAVKFSKAGETVHLSSESAGADVMLLIKARGRAIPVEALARFFQVFSIKEPITPGGDLGLGPPVAERIISLFGGAVVVENQDPPGILLKVHLKTSEFQLEA